MSVYKAVPLLSSHGGTRAGLWGMLLALSIYCSQFAEKLLKKSLKVPQKMPKFLKKSLLFTKLSKSCSIFTKQF